jgi:integrase
MTGQTRRRTRQAKAAHTARRSGGKRGRHGIFYERSEDHGEYWILRHPSGMFYVAWYAQGSRQTRRRSLRTRSSTEATKKVEKLIRDGVTGDPTEALAEKPMEFVAQALTYYRENHVANLRSAAAATSAIDNFLMPAFGATRIASLKKKTIICFADRLRGLGHSTGYVSRILSILRAAFNRAKEDEQIVQAPTVPEIRGEAEKEAEPLRGRELTIPEVALLFDNVCETHLLEFLVAEVNTAARPECVLQARGEQVEWSHDLFELNPKGRVQTKKYRPVTKIAATWKPWLERVPHGPIVTYGGKPVLSVKKAMQSLVKRSKLAGPINPTSTRHTLGRFLENEGVPGREISIFLGHVPVSKKKSSRRYSPTNPYHPDYLIHAIRAVEKFVRAVNRCTKKWDLEKPMTVKPGWRKEP